MIRRILFAIAVVGALAPQGAEAQIATWCDGIDVTRCFSVLNYSVLVTENDPAEKIVYSWEPSLSGVLSGVPSSESYLVTMVLGFNSASNGFQTTNLSAVCAAELTCFMSQTINLTVANLGLMPVPPPTIDDVRLLTVNVGRTQIFSCSPNGAETEVDRCGPVVSVPEPESFALLASGIVGLLGVGYRRRREA